MTNSLKKKFIGEKWTKKFDKTTFWGLISLLGMVLIFLFGYYFPRAIKPNISFEITNEANVLDVHKPLKDLAIAFQGEDIQKKNLNLRIFTIHIENNGDVNILEDHYASYEIWGFKVQNGKIIEVRLIESNDDNIKENLDPQLIKEDKEDKGDIVKFNKIIFDRKKYFTLEVLVLHPKNALPELIPLGKIAGIDKIVATEPRMDKGRKPFLLELLHGNMLVHIIRFFGYVAILILSFVFIGFLAIKIGNSREKRKTKSRRSEAVKILGIEASQEGIKSKIITDNYVYGGTERLKKLQTLLEDQEKLVKKIRKYDKAKEIEKLLAEFKAIDPGSTDVVDVPDLYMDMMLSEHGYKSYKDIQKVDFVAEGILKVGEKGEVIVDSEFKQILDNFIEKLAAQ